MKLTINKACDIASISVLPPRRTGGSSGGGGRMSAAAAQQQQQQRSQSMSQKSFSQGGGGVGSFSQSVGASFSQGMGSGGASFSQGRGASFSQSSSTGGAAAAFSQGGGGGGGGASFSQGRGASFSQGSGTGGAVAAFSQGGGAGSGGADFSQGRGGGGAAFSQGGGGGGASFSQGGGSGSLLHAQSQLSEASLNENLLSQAPARDQRFSLQEDSSKRTPSYPASSASCVREDSQLQLTTIPTNPIHRWSPSLPDSRCQINEEVERKFQHLASSVHKLGMILDSVQNDVMQLNRSMKEASLDSGSIQKKFVLLEDSLKQILKGQDDIKALFEGSTESNPDQLSVLNSHTRKLDEMTSILSALPNHLQAEFGQLKGDTYRIFTKEMEGIARGIRSINTRLDAMQMLAEQSCTTNAKTLMNQTAVAHGSPLMNQTPVAVGSTLMNQGAVADGSPLMNHQGPVADGRPQKRQRPAANGRSQRKKQTPVASGRAQRKRQRPVANGRPQVKQAQTADGRSQMNQKPEANGEALMKQVLPATQVAPAPLVYQRKKEGVQPKAEQGMSKAGTGAQKLAGSGDSRPASPKEQELAIQKDNAEAPINKAMLAILIDSDEEEEEGGGSEGNASCVLLKSTEAGGGVAMAEEAMGEGEALEILRRARKRRRREEANAVVLDH
ncbi:protein PAIR1-like isoform X3 [Hordeum vulgare subsp. vulgare]|uniref:Uncharacterized protein n=1 Tax=Hordeum vulgare subsp. vulgare TaxID=112509 RepID=A0A8I6XIT8_HORVV|nr:protein PAIR1-like isoform X3 [Hordeum vulgare subsp. vulgare]